MTADPGNLGVAGFFATAVAFGPARNGYGLFLPEIQDEFGLSTQASGFVASGLYAGYLGALLAVGLLAATVGSRLPVTIGLLSAALGMGIVAFSPNAVVLAAGVILAGTSAGWSWAPYNDAVAHTVPRRMQDRVLSVVSTGTTFGIAVAGLVALAAASWGMPWRTGWIFFAVCSLVVAALNARLLPGAPHGSERTAGWPGVGWFLRPASTPLFAVALSFGAVNAVYWSFAVDLLVSGAGGYSSGTGPALYAVMGVAGFAGLLTGDAAKRFGLRRVLPAALVSLGLSVGLLGAAPGWAPAVGASAVLFGASVMVMSAILSLWSSAVFRERPSTGFSAALLLFGVGCILGPAASGSLAGSLGLEAVFLLAAGVALATALVRPSKDLGWNGVEP